MRPSSRTVLREALRRAVDRSFNAITVDGDTSTNDTVLVLANGLAGPVDAGAFEAALTVVCQDLAQQIVRDAEGGTKFVAVRVTGAANEDEARQVAKTIATSVLVKTAVYGGDPELGAGVGGGRPQRSRVGSVDVCALVCRRRWPRVPGGIRRHAAGV